MIKYILLSISFVVLILSSCCDDETMPQPTAPCEWAMEYTAVSTACFDLPQGPWGPMFDAPYEEGVINSVSSFNPNKEGEWFYRKFDVVNSTTENPQFFRKNACIEDYGTTNIVAGKGKITTNSQGQILMTLDKNIQIYDPTTESFTVVIEGPLSVIELAWTTDTTFVTRFTDLTTFDGERAEYNIAGDKIRDIDFFTGTFSDQNKGRIAYYNSDDDALEILDPATFEVLASFPGIGVHSVWRNENELILREAKKISLLNVETADYEVLLDYSTCGNISFVDHISDPFNEDRVLIDRVDYFYNEDSLFRQTQNIIEFDIATGQERELVLE